MQAREIRVLVGCCGFPCSRKKYYQNYKLVELQNTFYNLPGIEWADKLRSEVGEGFMFTMKAWQVITHPSTSPTWRKLKEKPFGEIGNYGFLKPSRENYSAWEKTLEIAKVLKAHVIVLQTPASLPYSSESIKWVREFFKNIVSVTPREIVVGWEPRGVWASVESRSVLEEILRDNNITHIVDPFKRIPTHIHKVLYFRLHGIGPKETNYRYKYSDEDLLKLVKVIKEIGFSNVYVLFNNVYMFDDGLRFKNTAIQSGLKAI